ncbi:GNAT family N-acetyltransferase [Bacillus sp. S/N-304-OC-R1]|uniref:GNAT family N-acetyltransferase n=1 Tax=Bacillus sp. S/N-304-OC-R1 TaxID=2758034 RepID=UPI001C8E4273|nr:GNAT family N-acetyltransferase [Bacillus sp. S/N-304-OC-R1]MBY0122036.1 GNAT family N-acetyltransferase [Bacillus sp. S/N-304-OC-R1]
MKQSITFTEELPNQDELYQLYQNDGWNDFLKLPKETLHKAMQQSWYVLSAYDGNQLIGTGRIISDGVINGYICGVMVRPDYRNEGIGKEIVRRLVEQGMKDQLHIQLLSDESKAPYYERLGFEVFTVGMKFSKE